jgi:hypothetical protein
MIASQAAWVLAWSLRERQDMAIVALPMMPCDVMVDDYQDDVYGSPSS